MGRPKPATHRRAKSGHFEQLEICPLLSAFGFRRKRTVRWRINSRWRKFKQFWHLRDSAGLVDRSPGNLAWIEGRLDVTCGSGPRAIQNRPARPPGPECRPIQNQPARPPARHLPRTTLKTLASARAALDPKARPWG